MNERDYEKFFQLVTQIVNEPGKTYKEKKESLEKAAEDGTDQANLEELSSWFA